MELTQRNFVQRLERLKQLATSEESDEFEKLRKNLHEKGVECSVIVPLFEVLLEFDALTDISYEQESKTVNKQRFDFLIDNCFLIEAKELGTNLDEHSKQISDYIKKNDNINYGLLTNGVDFQVWVQRSFIEKIYNCKLTHTEYVTKVFDLSLETDSVSFVMDVLHLFKKSSYVASFIAIANVCGRYAAGGRGKPAIIHEDRAVNEEIQKRIKENVSVQKGVYFAQIESGEFVAGDKLQYKNDCIEITLELTKTGTVILRRDGANVTDFIKAMKEWAIFIKLVSEKWSKEDTEFQDPVEIMKLALDRQRLSAERYPFHKI